MPNAEFEVQPGQSILEMLWSELDESYAELMERQAKGVGDEAYTILRGRCAGLAIAISIIRNPYNPDDDIIRDEVAERYETRRR